MTHILENNSIKLAVSDIGGEPRSLVNKKSGREYLYDADPKWWDNTSPVLFPVTGRFRKGFYYLDGKEYTMPIHGFVRRNPMECVKVTETSVTHKRSSDDVSRPQYPFEFDFYITHELIEKSVKVTFKVVNRDKVTMPFQVGAHPAFFAKPGDVLSFKGKENLTYKMLDEQLLSAKDYPVDNKVTITENMFEKNAWFFVNNQLWAATLSDEKGEYLEVSFTGFPAAGFWNVVGSPYICIEPWFGGDDMPGTDDDFNHRFCIQHLAPGNTFEMSYYINILD